MTGPTGSSSQAGVLQKVSGSKLGSIIGPLLAGLGTICLTMRGEMDAILGGATEEICAAAALGGVIWASLSKGLGDQRDSEPTPPQQMPTYDRRGQPE